MLRLCYIYFDILNDDVTVLHKKHIQISIVSVVNFSCIHCNIIFNISSPCHSFYKTRHQMYLYKLTHVEICMMIYNHDNNHDSMVVLICFVVIPDSLDGSKEKDTSSDENSMSCVHDCGKLFVIFLSYKNAYHIQETKTMLVKEDCR